MADPKDKLRAFYDAIKANPNVKGVPDDYAQFETALKDPQKSRQFYESIKSNPTIKGIPTDFDQFSNGLGLSPGKAAPVGSGVPTGEQGKPSQQPSGQPQTGPTYSFTYQKEKPKKKELDISFTEEEMVGRGQVSKPAAPKPQVPKPQTPTAAEAIEQSFGTGQVLKELYQKREAIEALPEVQRIKREEEEYRAIKPVADEYRQNISGRPEGMDILGLQQAFKEAKGRDDMQGAAEIETQLKDAYKAIDEDYLQYVISTRPQLGNDKIAMYENIRAKQEKGEKLSQPDERFMKDLRDEAMSAYYTAKKAELYELKTQASIGEYMRDTGLLSKRADILQQEYDSLAGKPLTAQSRKRIAEIQNELQGVQGKAEEIAKQTGVTPEVLDRYNKLQTDIAAVDMGFEDNSDRFASLQEEEMDKRIRDQYRKDEGMAKAVMYSFSDAINQGLGGAAKFVKTEIAPPDGKVDFADELYNWAENWQQKSTSRVGRPFSAEEWDKMSMIDKAPYLFGEGLGSVTLFAAGGAAGRGTKLGTAISAYVMAEPGAYEEAISLGMDIDEARSVARPIAAAEAMIESMIPDIKYFNAPNFRKSILKQVKEGVPLKEAIATNTKQFLKEVGENSVKEFGEETAAAVAVDTTKEAINAAKGEDIYKDTFDPEAIAEQGVAGFLTGGGMSAVGSITRPRSPIAEDMVLQLAENPDQITRVAEIVAPEELDFIEEIRGEVDELYKEASKIPGFKELSREDKATVISELQRKKQIESGVKGTGVDTEGAQAQIAEIDARVGEILEAPAKLEADYKTVEEYTAKAAEASGLSPVEVVMKEALGEPIFTMEDVDNLIKDNEIEEGPCPPGFTSKAEHGATTGFASGGKWEIVTEFKGKTHDEGGIDIEIKGGSISHSDKDGKFKAEQGAYWSMYQPDQLQPVNTVDQGPNKGSFVQGAAGSFGPWGAAIAAGSGVGNQMLTGTKKSSFSNAIGVGVFDPAQNLRAFTDKRFSGKDKALSLLSPFYYGGMKNRYDRRDMLMADMQQKIAAGQAGRLSVTEEPMPEQGPTMAPGTVNINGIVYVPDRNGNLMPQI